MQQGRDAKKEEEERSAPSSGGRTGGQWNGLFGSVLQTFDNRFFLYFIQGVAFGLGQHGAKLLYELIWQRYVTGTRKSIRNG
eukprot:g4902.t1